mmetsp:Transcript_23530/g.38846  ORF Transcript_23530/g.38846 Transcript_23530/m.38846 type:complete len:200 (+) Transcript_23530:126-725(+)
MLIGMMLGKTTWMHLISSMAQASPTCQASQTCFAQSSNRWFLWLHSIRVACRRPLAMRLTGSSVRHSRHATWVLRETSARRPSKSSTHAPGCCYLSCSTRAHSKSSMVASLLERRPMYITRFVKTARLLLRSTRHRFSSSRIEIVMSRASFASATVTAGQTLGRWCACGLKRRCATTGGSSKLVYHARHLSSCATTCCS